MQVDEKRAQAAKDCFDYNKKINTVYVTADLSCFALRSDAVNHARTLLDKTIDVFNRDEDTDETEFDELESESLTDESETIPDLRNAVIKAIGGKGAPFKKVEKAKAEPIVTAPQTNAEQPVIINPVTDPQTTTQAEPAQTGGIAGAINHIVDVVEGAVGLGNNPQA